MRVRLRYAKTGKIRFTSAIDLGRLWERALRKADLPIAYSEGFSPHPKVSFSDALPLGYAATGEYAELTFAVPVTLPAMTAAANAAFPDGLRILDAREVTEGAPKLARWLAASCWDLDYPPGITGLPAAVAAALDAERLPVARQRKGEPVEIDLRPALHCLGVTDTGAAGSPIRVRAMTHHVEPPVRPSEVHLALVASLPDLPEPVLVTRVAQGQPVADGLIEAIGGALVPRTPPPSDFRTTQFAESEQP